MNDDELESFLRELPGPELPAAWRGTVLAAARGARSGERAAAALRRTPPWPMLLGWLRGQPVTVGGLGLLWAIILLLKTGTPDDRAADRLMAQAGANAPDRLVALGEELRLAELWQDGAGSDRVVQP